MRHVTDTGEKPSAAADRHVDRPGQIATGEQLLLVALERRAVVLQRNERQEEIARQAGAGLLRLYDVL